MPMEFAAWLTPAILIAIGALLLRSISRLEDRLGARIDDVSKRIDGLDDRLRTVEHGQARVQGLLEGLREAISGRRPAA